MSGTVTSLRRNTGQDLEMLAMKGLLFSPWRWQVGNVWVASIRTQLMQRTGNPHQNALSHRKEMAWPWLVSSPQSNSLFQLQNQSPCLARLVAFKERHIYQSEFGQLCIGSRVWGEVLPPSSDIACLLLVDSIQVRVRELEKTFYPRGTKAWVAQLPGRRASPRMKSGSHVVQADLGFHR